MTSTHAYYALETAKNYLFLYCFEYAFNDLFCLDVHHYGLSSWKYGEVVAKGVNLSTLKRTERESQVAFYSAFSEEGRLKKLSPIPFAVEWCYPKISSVICSINEMWDRGKSPLVQLVQWIAGGVLGWFAPTLSVKALPGELKGPYDHVYVARDQMGVVGTFKKGLEGGLRVRIQKRPKQFLWGVIQLVCCLIAPILLVKLGMLTRAVLIAKLTYDTFYALSSCFPASINTSLYSTKMF